MSDERLAPLQRPADTGSPAALSTTEIRDAGGLTASDRSSRRWVVYSTFDAAGAAAPFAVDQLRAYRELGFETLVVDTSPEMSDARASDWAACSTLQVRRPNSGYDFASYAHGLDVLQRHLDPALTECAMLFTNDSCYGPYSPLAEVFARFDDIPPDEKVVFGITDSRDTHHHLQSYWLFFRPNVLPLARRFFSVLPSITNRPEAIAYGELGLSAYLSDAGCRLVALHSTEAVVDHFSRFHGKYLSVLELAIRRWIKRPRYTLAGDRACLKRFVGETPIVNPTLAFGTHMHYQGLTPFVKRQLIRQNPEHDAFVPPVADVSALDNAGVDALLRSTDAYRRRYGKSRRSR